MFISVYTIAKNEEKVAERWFNCFKEADEVCVLVNNSTDKTAEILRKLGAKVVEKNYEHFRFDIARNEAMKMCSPKATLLFGCDMDDTIEAGWRIKIERAWQLGVQTGRNPNSILFSYSVEYETYDKVAKGSRKQKQSFARHSIHTPNGWYWKSRIHEYLEHSKRKVFLYFPRLEVISRPTRCEHGSYLPLLIEECQDPNCEARNIHLLGREYMLNGKYDEAVEWFNKYLSHIGATWDSERAASMRFLSDCYRVLGFPNAQELWLWKAMSENPRDRDAPFALGQLLMDKKEYKTAIRILEKCLSIEKPEFDYPFFSLAAWTEIPLVCLGESKYYVGDWNGALNDLDKALSINPKNETARKMRDEIASIIAKGGRPNLPPSEIPRERIDIPELM